MSCTQHVHVLNYSQTNAHMAGSICATRPNRSPPLVTAGLRGGGDVPAPPIGQPSDRSIGAQSRLQIRERCWRRRRSQRRRQQLPLLSNAPRSDAGVLGPPWTTKAPPGARRPVRWHPLRAAPAGAPTTAVAPPLMEGRSAPLPPRRRWEGHWWWPGRPSAAARGARAAVAACAATASSGAAWLRAGLAGAARHPLLFSTKQNSSQLRKLKRAGWKH